MKVMTTSDARKNFAAALDAVINDQEELVIPRDGGSAVVIVDLNTWNSLKETMHVLGSANNTRRLLASMAQLDAGEGIERDLVEPAQRSEVSAGEATEAA